MSAGGDGKRMAFAPFRVYFSLCALQFVWVMGANQVRMWFLLFAQETFKGEVLADLAVLGY